MRWCASPTRTARPQITAPGTKVADLPAGPINHHWTKNIIASPDGTKLYATVGSNSNVGENGMDKEEGRAAILEIDLATGERRAVRLRPAQSQRHGLAAADRRAVDRRQRARRDRQRSGARLYDLGAGRRVLRLALQLLRPARRHAREAAAARSGRQGDRARTTRSARTPPRWASPSGGGTLLPASFASGAFIGQHGSWNRKPRSGYKVIFVPFADGKPSGPAGRRADRLPQR